jgi:hypothetical protein
MGAMTSRTSPADNGVHRAAAPAACRRSNAAPRARQTLPPSLRRAVLERDHHRCQVPGCTHSTYVDVHHIQRHADGGSTVIWKLIHAVRRPSCAAHNGGLLIERGAHGTLVLRHADGSLYGQPATPRVDVHAKVFSALRHLGFRESEVKAVLGALALALRRRALTLAGLPRRGRGVQLVAQVLGGSGAGA